MIDDSGTMLGVMSLDDALDLAKGNHLDLVEIAPKAKPPTCKVMDYGKWKFNLKKKEKEAKKKQVKIVVKEIQVRPQTDKYDLDIKVKKGRDFLVSGYKVKLHLRFSGRELAHKDKGLDVIDKVAVQLQDLTLEDVERSKFERRSVYAMFSPDPIKIKEYLKKNPPKKLHIKTKEPPPVQKKEPASKIKVDPKD